MQMRRKIRQWYWRHSTPCSISETTRLRSDFGRPKYIQHSAHIAPGREGLFDLIKGIPATLKYEPGTIVAEGDIVIVHGRFSNFGLPVNWIAADIVRIKGGILVEHRDVIQDEATEEQSRSKRPMFGKAFPTYK
jgi:predicted SnoaL-like aldol condensation-catalyzing enzyme